MKIYIIHINMTNKKINTPIKSIKINIKISKKI